MLTMCLIDLKRKEVRVNKPVIVCAVSLLFIVSSGPTILKLRKEKELSGLNTKQESRLRYNYQLFATGGVTLVIAIYFLFFRGM